MLQGVDLRVQLAHSDKWIRGMAPEEGSSIFRSLLAKQDFVAIAVCLGHVLTAESMATRLHVFRHQVAVHLIRGASD